jgi:ABC-2 type transport system ATP-binding protein
MAKKPIGGNEMIELVNVSKSYNGTIKAVDDLSLVVPEGQIVGFLGPNGAGKTTTIKMIAGILNADSGNIVINGIDVKERPLEAKRQFGFVPDSPDMFLRLKGIEYLNFIADVYMVSGDLRGQRIQELSETFEMEAALNDQIQSYSHGMRQKIVIMGVLIHDPSVWILDEPMTGLDPRSSFTLKEMMKSHAASGKTVFFSTHVLEVAEKLCDKVAIINKGKLLFYGTMEEMRAHFESKGSLEKIFLELTENE